MHKKTIAIIGSESTIGRGLEDLRKSFNIIFHHGSTLEWNHPMKTEYRIQKGFPDAFVIAYSAWDQMEERLCGMLKVIQKAASSRKVKIIGFVSSNIYEGVTQKTPIDEMVEPRPLTTSAKAETLYEERLLKYPNSLVFRLGEYYDSVGGFPTKLARRIMSNPTLLVDESSQFSLTHRVTTVKAIQRAVEYDMVHCYQLVDQGEVTERDLYELMQIYIKVPKRKDSEEFCKGDSYRVLDGTKWETVSMTEGVHWSTPAKFEIPQIIRSTHGTK